MEIVESLTGLSGALLVSAYFFALAGFFAAFFVAFLAFFVAMCSVTSSWQIRLTEPKSAC